MILKPLLFLFGYGIALLGYMYTLIVHFTSRIEILGQEYLNKDSNYILCLWHQNIFIYFMVFLWHKRHVWMQHPIWFMKPSHIFLRMIGVSKIILGSTGHAGREAADELVAYLKKGYSTAIMPDGPAGPAFEIKKGIFHISQQSGVALVPMQFNIRPSIELNRWDKRKWPMPFSRINICYKKPIYVKKAISADLCHKLNVSL
jgi:lysophospholipid acyltransferase (LPLAT)-like uncharacterized protein